MITILASLITAYSILIIVSVVLSWVSYSSQSPQLRRLSELVGVLVDPYLDLFRRVIPPLGGLDLSPIIGLVVLQIIGRALIGLLAGL